jgi:hypothetical protein
MTEPTRPLMGYAKHHLLIGHDVTVRTPGDIPHRGILISVGNDRLVLHNTLTGITPVTRLMTTGVEPTNG